MHYVLIISEILLSIYCNWFWEKWKWTLKDTFFLSCNINYWYFFFHSWIVFAVTSLKTFCFRFLASRVTQENMNMFILVCILLSKKKFLIDIIFSYLIFYFWQTLQILKENCKSSQLHRILNKYKAFIVKYNPNLFCLSLLCCLF